MRSPGAPAAFYLILLGVSCLAPKQNGDPAIKKPVEDVTVTIDMSALTKSKQTQTFREVRQASLLPKTVLDQIDGMADPGKPFNRTDFVDSRLPMRQLIVAAVSKQYCIVSYWQGGRALFVKTDIFELLDGSAKIIWVSSSQTRLSLRDLKEMIESGRMHNDLDHRGLQPIPPAS